MDEGMDQMDHIEASPGMDGMDEMDGMDGEAHGDMDQAMDGAMDGEMGEGMDEDDDEKSEANQEKVFDITKDSRVMWMIEQQINDLPNYDPTEPAQMMTAIQKELMYKFLEDFEYSKLFVWVDQVEPHALLFSYDQPPKFEPPAQNQTIKNYSFCYFLKAEGKVPILRERIEEQLVFDLVVTDPLDDLLNKMQSDYVNKFLGENDWPEGVKKDFVASLHNFMATLTEQSNLSKGKTYLYIPQEDLNDVDTAATDKDLLQRLETTVIFWTRQIKELVSNQDVNNQGDSNTPLDEIKHWEDRNNNLKVVSLRLKDVKLKKIIEVLEKASSSYLQAFQDLTKEIDKGHEEADDNLKFLGLLYEPCKKIEAAQPKDIPKLLPEVLNNVRIIFELSKHYNSTDKIKPLLTKIGNQIIRRCCKKINKDDMLNGDVEKCMRDLDESIDCCEQWIKICTRTLKIIKIYTTSTAKFDIDHQQLKDASFFQETIGFIGRCSELKDICEGQLQFAQKGSNSVMPKFGGTRGSEWTTSLNELKTEFERYLQKIKDLEYDILDFKITKWGDDYTQNFKEQVKSIENIYNTIIMMTFKYVSTIEDAVEMLENFHVLAKRTNVINFVNDKAAAEVYNMFEAEIKEVEDIFDNFTHKNKRPPMPFSHPQYAGMAVWVKSLIHRIDRARDAILQMNFIPKHERHDKAIERYEKLLKILDSHISRSEFDSWTKSISDGGDKGEIQSTDLQIEKALSDFFLTKDLNFALQDEGKASKTKDKKDAKKKGGQKEQYILKNNFNTRLLKILIEVQYWNKLQSVITIPHTLGKLVGESERLRVLRENVMLIVRDFNNIMVLIDDRERRLFDEHLGTLNKTYELGLKKHNWHSSQDTFILNCRKECSFQSQLIKQFQGQHRKIDEHLQKISSMLLIQIQKKCYDLTMFIGEQKQVMKKNSDFFKNTFEQIRQELKKMYSDLFISKGPAIQQEWMQYIDELDRKLRKALQNSVKTSLHEFQKNIRGDQATTQRIFRIDTILDRKDPDQDSLPVKHDPDFPKLKSSITQFIKDIIQTTSEVPKLETIFRKDRAILIQLKFKEDQENEKIGGGNQNRDIAWKNLSEEEKLKKYIEDHALPKAGKSGRDYVDKIQRNPEIEGYMKNIIVCVDEIKIEMENDCRNWRNQPFVSHLHSMKTDRGKNRFLKQVAKDNQKDDPVQRYKGAIDHLEEVLQDIKNEPSTKNQGFIEIDATKLKSELIDQGNSYISSIFNELAKQSKKELQDFLKDLTDKIDELKKTCDTPEQLKRNMELKKETQANKANLFAKIQPIKQKFQFLQSDENGEYQTVELTEQEKQDLATLDEAWKRFDAGLAEANLLIQKAFAEQKTMTEQLLDDFKKEVIENRDIFQKTAPKEINIPNNQALDKIEEFRNKCREFREKEEQYKFQQDIFEIEPLEYRELAQVEKENELLYKIWQLKDQWDEMNEEWKNTQFYDLKTDDMENRAEELIYQVSEIEKQSKEVRSWPLTESLKTRIKEFQDTKPLIQDLQQNTMRDRHWNELRHELKEEFREKDMSFNYEKVMSLQLTAHMDKIQELTENARKQFSIENDLKEIREMWEKSDQSNLDVVRGRSVHDNEDFFKLNSTENIMQLIEEHSNKLARHKSSQYYRDFDEQIDFWESQIASITETLEMLMQVQSMWQYLESIFFGQADIVGLLTKEHGWFIKVHEKFKQEMKRVYNEKKCYEALVLSHVGNFINILKEMNITLEKIKKNLNQFLDNKRLSFPRFFFMPNEDLLEIIGQARDPGPVNKHINKMFEGIKELWCPAPTGSKGQKVYTIQKIRSPDEEEIDISSRPLTIESRVEGWLSQLLDIMKETLQRLFHKHHQDLLTQNKSKMEKEKMLQQIKNGKGQILLTYSMIEWTKGVEDALKVMESNPTQMKKIKQTYKKKVSNLIELIEKPGLSSVDRKKINTLIVMEEHNREVIDRLLNDKTVTNQHHFNWVSQLRYFKEEDGSDKMYIKINQLNATFKYGYEYQGNNGRLVVTPLTDRAYMTLTNALDMKRGGAPQGPAGTGKTETVKDLGKNLAYQVYVQNCSPENTHEGLGDHLQGLSMSGTWGCFDEFNRILVDVLSVITTYIDSIFQALRQGDMKDCQINEKTCKVSENVGLFITMNPGYAGRTELPDNLSALFRPVAMMVPDFFMISKIELMAEGFQLSEKLAGKITTIYEIMSKQLSKQQHYDFTMRAIKSVLRHSGRVKRENPGFEEIQVVIKAIRDMNLPRFLAEDVILFDNLFIDLFPSQEEPDLDMDDLQIQIEQALIRKKLELNENIVVKCMQLYESKCTRHGNMLIGSTMSGKTTTWEILQDALNTLFDKEKKEREKNGMRTDEKEKPYRFKQVKTAAINPKAVSLEELYGCMSGDGADRSNQTWREGVLQRVLKDMCESPPTENRWMIMDGPVDTIWIETMNSVLDDSKLLTLTNGDRIKIESHVNLLFEVENLDIASPATVSRAGMIYLDIEELHWKTSIIESWIKGKADHKEDFQERLRECVTNYLEKVMTVKKVSCRELVKTSEAACIRNFCNLFDCCALKEFKFNPGEDREAYLTYVEKWFVFAVIWSIGCTVESESRMEIDQIIREVMTGIPLTGTVYDYYINPDRKDFQMWADKLHKDETKFFKDKKFHEIQVQTVDSYRNGKVVEYLLLNPKSQILLVGHSGVGKTSLVEGILRSIDHTQMSFTLNFSAGTTSNSVQDIIESNYNRGAKNKFKPKNSKTKAICFIDDLNMPRLELGSQPPLELLRQFVTYGYWYDRTLIVKNEIERLQLLACMGMPGGGRAVINNRVLSRFHLINYTVLDEASMMKIYKTIADSKFAQFNEEIKVLTEQIAQSTIALFNFVQKEFRPIPAKSHYIFNMRDISKVFEGLYLADKRFVESKEQIVKMWSHEVMRVFYDRLIEPTDQALLKKSLNEQMEQGFQMNFEEHCSPNGQDAIFVNFLSEGEPVYDEVQDFSRLRDFLNEKLEAYNSQGKKVTKMDIVLFRDAIIHISKIYRVINFQRGHCLLVGVGGSGRHSLTRLAAYISDMSSDQLQIRSDFSLKDFRFKLQSMYKHAAFGQKQPKTVFIFSDNDVVDEVFLEDIQNQLNGGMVPNIFNTEDLYKIKDEVSFKKEYKRDGQTSENPDAQTEWLYRRIKDNMHLSICMSPIGEKFRNFTRMYPALINNTTIDWFMPWPLEALSEVADKFIGIMEIDQKFKTGMSQLSAFLHFVAQKEADDMKKELGRIFYVTPTNFVELLKGYDKIIRAKRNEIGANITKLDTGLTKLEKAAEEVREMTAEAQIKGEEAQQKSEDMQKLMSEINIKKEQANREQINIKKEKDLVKIEQEEAERIAADAQEQLALAQPALENAKLQVESLDSKSINEIKAYTSPPKDVTRVMAAVMTLLKESVEWAQVKKVMGDSGFQKKLMTFDPKLVTPDVIKRIQNYTSKDDFTVENMTQKSKMCGILCGWVKATEDYYRAWQIVLPKQKKLEEAERVLAAKKEYLQKLEDEFEKVQKELASLEEQYKTSNEAFKETQAELEKLRSKIDRGDRMIQGLGDEKIRWEKDLANYRVEFYELIGDSVLAAAYMSYCGPFPADFRQRMNKKWMAKIRDLNLPHKKNFTFIKFLTNEEQMSKWQADGLPTDDFSNENGVFVTKGLRWALNIDPQSQAQIWIKNMYRDKLLIADPKDKGYLQVIRQAIMHGHTVLLQDIVGDTLDPTLDNVLNKAYVKSTTGGSKATFSVKFGADDITYDERFKLLMTTREPNPHYTPEVSTKVAVINFTVVESGLEEQCLGIVVRQELPQLEEQRVTIIKNISQYKKKMTELEDSILARLQNSNQNLLEDTELDKQLQKSKETAQDVIQNLEAAESTIRRINENREQFKSCAKKASALFFVLNDLNKINPMYQFSLDKYKDLFKKSIEEKDQGTNSQDQPTQRIEKVHTLNVYRNTCKSLFEQHKLLLALSMCIKLQMAEGKVAAEDYDFFLRGGSNVDSSAAKDPKPSHEWIKQTTWDQLCELQTKLPIFGGITYAVNVNAKEWKHWYQSTSPEPEDAQLPGEWVTKCEDPIKKMIILRCFRPDRVNFAIRAFVKQRMNNEEFITSRPTSIAEVVDESKNDVPVIFVLSPGTDPTAALQSSAKSRGDQKIIQVSLGKGQGGKAQNLLEESAKEGYWIFLQNCHLSVSILPEIESIMEELFKKKKMHPNFRIFMSAVPIEDFPISLLQRSLKITQEPPRGIRNNMLRLYKNMDKEFTDCDQDQKFRKAVYGLCWFHTILIERKKFKTLGWNVEYSFNDSDYKVCEDTLANYFGRKIDEITPENYDPKRPVPWTAIQQLVAQANYGGRVTDDRDRRLIMTYAKEIFCDDLVQIEKWRPKGTEGFNYHYPIDEAAFKGNEASSIFTPEFFFQQIEQQTEKSDVPAAYGQHTNAEINSQISDSLDLLNSILSLQPAKSSSGGKSIEVKTKEQLEKLQALLPEQVNITMLKHKMSKVISDGDPLTTVLIQEVTRYNILLEIMAQTITDLSLGIIGDKVITQDLERMMRDLSENRVPIFWSGTYFSLKPLASWFVDLLERYAFFTEWSLKGLPHVFTIGFFTYPTGFTTSLLQKFSRKPSGPAIDLLSFEFLPKSESIEELKENLAKDGAYIFGLYLEGANWHKDKAHLIEPNIMELEVEMPVIHFKPQQRSKTKIQTNVYTCPCYYYPIRKGIVGRDSFMMNIDLKIGPDQSADHWVKRGTALLMSLKD